MRVSLSFLVLVIVFAIIITNNVKKKCIKTETAIDLPLNNEIHGQQIVLTHLACIMDGNRRWAKKRGLSAWQGHGEGIQIARSVVEFCLEKNIKYLTLYILSPENLSRPLQELNYLFELMATEAKKGADEYKKQGICIRFRGDRSLFPSSLIPLLDDIEKETAGMQKLQVTLLFCYGGRQEIVAAVKNIIKDVKNGSRHEDEISPDSFHSYLWTADLPDPDLIIRTGCVSRLSNFLLYQAAYSELYMLDCLWPDVTKEHLQDALDFYANTKRTFGK